LRRTREDREKIYAADIRIRYLSTDTLVTLTRVLLLFMLIQSKVVTFFGEDLLRVVYIEEGKRNV